MPNATGRARMLAPMTSGSHKGANAKRAILSCKGKMDVDLDDSKSEEFSAPCGTLPSAMGGLIP